MNEIEDAPCNDNQIELTNEDRVNTQDKSEFKDKNIDLNMDNIH